MKKTSVTGQQLSLDLPKHLVPQPKPGRKLKVAGLFAGIGGIELGLHRAGHETVLLCENDKGAGAVLGAQFPKVPLVGDVRSLSQLPSGVDLLTAGFPCQDLSQAGATAGIRGDRSSLVDEALRIAQTAKVPWLLLENVPFMLQLHRGQALDHIISTLESLGYWWAYRVVDSRSMGLPQRRERVYLLASTEADPRAVLFADEENPPDGPNPNTWRSMACGFYWTEGLRGLGWAYDAVPTLKCGSTLGIPSPPAIVMPSGDIVKPDIRDAERLQGFEANWTLPAEQVAKSSHRWRLVGNAVTVDVAEWIGHRLSYPGDIGPRSVPLRPSQAWPKAAWGRQGERHQVLASSWPCRRAAEPLDRFLQHETTPLSMRAASGFFSRAKQAKLRFPPGFLAVVEQHISAR